MYVPNADFFQLGDLDCAEDGSWIGQSRYFLKRKFMSTGWARKKLSGRSLVDQYY